MTGMARTGVVEGTRPALFSEATSPSPRPRSLSFNVYMASKHIEIATEAVEDTTDDDFIPYEIPDRLQDDCLVKYFRIRFHDQEYFLSKLNNPTKKDAQKMKMTIEKMKIEAHRIAKEIDRIEKLRLSFASTPENALRMWHYESCRSQWKNHAIDSREENIRTLKERIQEMELEEQESIRRQNWERRILDKVRKWNKAPITQRPNDPEGAKKAQEKKDIEEKKARERKEASAKARLDRLLFTLRGGKGNEEEAKPKPKKNKGRVDPQKDPRPRPDDSYGLTITKITLRRSDPACNSSFMSYKMKKYPLNDCLFKEEDNPLTEACEPNTIRYFHIPANNMHWIEVCSFWALTSPVPTYRPCFRKPSVATTMRRRPGSTTIVKTQIISGDLLIFSVASSGPRYNMAAVMIQSMLDTCVHIVLEYLPVRLTHQ